MSQHITTDGHCYVVDDSDRYHVHMITVWVDGITHLVCDIEIDHNTESAQVIYSDQESVGFNYQEYVENVEKLGLKDADAAAACWAVSTACWAVSVEE